MTTTDTELLRRPDRGTIPDRDGDYYGSLYSVEAYRGERGGKFGVEILPDGCNFAVRVSSDTECVDFCCPDSQDPTNNELCYRAELQRTEDTTDGGAIYTGFIPGFSPGSLYYIRKQEGGHPDSYDTPLIDPYARAITRLGQPDRPDSPIYCVVTDGAPDIPMVERPKIDLKDRVIYEAHIGDATKRNLNIPEHLRGTYLGFAHPENIERLKELGVTTVNLQPIHQFVTEPMIADRGMENHWGYNTVGFFAPHEGYASSKEPGASVREFKEMINALHAAGIEVVLDVVYNHTADGPLEYEDDDGEWHKSPTYSLRGLDEEAYYATYIDEYGRLRYRDTTGVGNTLDTEKPATDQLVRDSLRYWYGEMGVDGFRFDLAPSVGDGRYFESLREDPELEGCLMIVEPWSWGCGYPRGSFAEHGILEWDGVFRDTVRDFWRGGSSLGDLARVMADRFDQTGGVKFITAHDGFTLADLVAYNNKHNGPNRQPTNNGTDDNFSHNHGVEGPTDDPEIIARRERTARNLAHTLFTSIGGAVMWLGGDEVLHTQNGNNNAYPAPAITDEAEVDIHSRPWSSLSPEQLRMTKTVAGVTAVRKSGSFGDPEMRLDELPDSRIKERGIDWFNLWGNRMEIEDWGGRVMGMYVSGIAGSSDQASYITYVNGGNEDVTITLPQVLSAKGDYVLVADAETGDVDPDGLSAIHEKFTLKAMSSVVLKRVTSRLP